MRLGAAAVLIAATGCYFGFEWCGDSCPARRHCCPAVQDQAAALHCFSAPGYHNVHASHCALAAVCGMTQHQCLCQRRVFHLLLVTLLGCIALWQPVLQQSQASLDLARP
jgi:hypothetical protein